MQHILLSIFTMANSEKVARDMEILAKMREGACKRSKKYYDKMKREREAEVAANNSKHCRFNCSLVISA